MHNQKSLIIWDLDGTLLDVRPGVHKSVDYVAIKHGLRLLSKEERALMIANPRIKNGFEVAYGLSENEAEICACEFREIYLRNYLYEAKLYPGILCVLERFREQGMLQTIATNKGEEHAMKLSVYFGLTQYCFPIVGSWSVNTTKKDILAKCIKCFSRGEITNITMIGDNYADRSAAQKCGIKFLGVNYGYGFHAIPNYANAPEEILTLIKTTP